MATETGSDQMDSGEEVEFGLAPNVAAAASYIPIVGLIYLIMEDDNEFVLFHAAQSLVYVVAWQVLGFVVGIVVGILGFIPVIGDFAGLLSLFVQLGGIVFWFFLVYQAYSGEKFEIPVLAGLAEQLADAV